MKAKSIKTGDGRTGSASRIQSCVLSMGTQEAPPQGFYHIDLEMAMKEQLSIAASSGLNAVHGYCHSAVDLWLLQRLATDLAVN